MRAISPVIATVIIVSIAIALAIAVALWMAGITTTVSQFERLDITAAYVAKTPAETNAYYEVILKVSNKGSSAATIDMVFINNKPFDENDMVTDTPTITTGNDQDDTVWTIEYGGNFYDSPVTLNPGESATVHIFLDQDAYTSGQVVQITVHTASGGQYPKAVSLP